MRACGHLALILSFSFLHGCAVPARWATNLPSQLRCGMSVVEVEEIADRPVIEVNRTWGTHFIGGETERTMVSLTFEKQGLRYVQVVWSEAPIGLGVPQRGPKIDLCDPNSD